MAAILGSGGARRKRFAATYAFPAPSCPRPQDRAVKDGTIGKTATRGRRLTLDFMLEIEQRECRAAEILLDGGGAA